METSLHRQLKHLYVSETEQQEVQLGRYRIDAVRDELLIEIQHGSLAAIRDKIRHLLAEHSVLVVKPIIFKKRLIKLAKKEGKVVSRRLSPKRGSALDIFSELVYFTRVYPHERLVLEVPLVDIEERRYPGHGRRRRRRQNDFQVQDQTLVTVHETTTLRTAADLLHLLDLNLPSPFDTADLADGLNVNRWIAQRIAYCLRETGAVERVGKRGNTILYSAEKTLQAA